MVLAGVPWNVVQAVMRHSTMTLRIDAYGHLKPGATAEAVESLVAIMTPAVEPLLAKTGTDDGCRIYAENGVRNGTRSLPRGATNSYPPAPYETPAKPDRFGVSDGVLSTAAPIAQLAEQLTLNQ